METATNTQPIKLLENSPSPLTYEFLREEGLKHIRELGGDLWSDHNVGDPGITMLEVLCMAIANISSRTNIDIKELVANQQGELYDNIYSPQEILPCNPLTINDFRKLLIDLQEVKNAWIEPVKDVTTIIYHNRADQSVSLQGIEEDKVIMKGLYTVAIEKEESSTKVQVEQAVKNKLKEHQNLCERFPTVKVLEPQKIAINATLEIGEVSNVEQLLAEIYARIDRFISPRVQSYTLQELLEKGKRMDEIIEGPWLKNGFIDTQELERNDKKKELRSSDLIQEMMDVPGVTLVKHIQMYEKGACIGQDGLWKASWILPLETDKAPQLLDPGQDGNKITLIQGSVTVATIDWGAVKDKYNALKDSQATSSAKTQDFKLSKSSVGELAQYDSVQNNFPDVYGIGNYGLSERVSSLRKAQAKQLKAYLLFFDQLLANYLSQLANVKDLFAYNKESAAKELKTYFSQTLFEAVPHIDTVLSEENYESALAAWQETSSVALERKNRFLNHLMARFGEKFNEYALQQYASQQESEQPNAALQAKYEFIQNYPTVSSQRATKTGLQERIRTQLGLTDAAALDMIEHIALRPLTTKQSGAFFTFARPLHCQPDTDDARYIVCHSPNHGLQAGEVIVVRESIYYQGTYKVEKEGLEANKFKVKQQVPASFPQALDAGQWFKYGTHRDPFSLQLSFVFPKAQDERFNNQAFQTYAQEVIRAETPAHIKVYVHWFDASQMEIFNEKKESPDVAMLEAPFNLGRQLPWSLPDGNLPVTKTTDEISGDVVFIIGDENAKSEKEITYHVRDEETGASLGSEKGDGKGPITIPVYKLPDSAAFDVLALNERTSVGVELIQVAPAYAVVIADNPAAILVENSQQESIYELVDADNDQIVMSSEPVAGTSKTISLFTVPLKLDAKLRVRTTAGNGISKVYKKDILVEVLKTALDYNADPIVFSGETAEIQIQGSQEHVKYELREEGQSSDSPLMDADGNGRTITLTTEELTTDSTFKIKAVTLPIAPSNVTKHPYEDLEIEAAVQVHPSPIIIEKPSSVPPNRPVIVKIPESYAHVSYQLEDANQNVVLSNTVPGNGGKIELRIESLRKSTSMEVFAIIQKLEGITSKRSVSEKFQVRV